MNLNQIQDLDQVFLQFFLFGSIAWIIDHLINNLILISIIDLIFLLLFLDLKDQQQDATTSSFTYDDTSSSSSDQRYILDDNNMMRNNNNNNNNSLFDNDDDDDDKNKNNHSNNNNNNIYDYSTAYGSTDDELLFDSLGPFEKLCKLCDDPTPSHLEIAPKYVVGALEFSTTQEDYVKVFSYLKRFCFLSGNYF